MYQIKFGTDGWREIIGDNYTTANVRRVASATAHWLKSANLDNSCIIGYDCRFGGEMFAKETAVTFASMGIEVHLSKGFVSTPMISLGVSRKKLGLGIIITASHNPPSYNGFKIKANYGGPATPDVINEIETLITESELPKQNSFDDYVESGLIQYVDLEKMYIDHCKENFNI
jgi:phosphomannomutase